MQRVLPAMVISQDVISLCKQVICEHDPEKLLKLTLQISELLDPQEDGSRLANLLEGGGWCRVTFSGALTSDPEAMKSASENALCTQKWTKGMSFDSRVLR